MSRNRVSRLDKWGGFNEGKIKGGCLVLSRSGPMIPRR
jgi:hypothetical protein